MTDPNPPTPPPGAPAEGMTTPDGAWRWQGGTWVLNASTPSESGIDGEQIGNSNIVTLEDPPPRPTSRIGHRRQLIVGAIILTVIAATSILAVTRSTGGDSASVNGSLTLTGGGGYTRETPCHGYQVTNVDFSDMQSETAVKILDASGTILGTTRLGPGTYKSEFGVSDGCEFAFTVRLDHTSTHYQIVIANRDPYDFDNINAVHLSIGGPR